MEVGDDRSESSGIDLFTLGLEVVVQGSQASLSCFTAFNAVVGGLEKRA